MSQPDSKLSRRTLFGAAAATGAAAAAVAMIPARQTEPEVAKTPEPPARGGGYQLSEHVKQYYRTTRI